MLTQREILSTLEMLKNEHLDVRTVTLGVNLLDCASHDFDKLKDNIHTRISHFAHNLVSVCNQVGQKYGIPVVNKRIAISPIAVVGASMSSSQLVDVARVLDTVAAEVNVDFIGGFTALVEKGIARGDYALIEAIPEALALRSAAFLIALPISKIASILMPALVDATLTDAQTRSVSAKASGIASIKA